MIDPKALPTEEGSPNDAWRRLLSQIAGDWPPQRWRHVGVLIACSGGADSVGMTTALHELRKQGSDAPRGFLVVAHFNHRLRGDQSDGDETFVSDLAARFHLPLAVRRASQQEASDEATLRRQRLEFLADAAHARGCRYVALAHSLDDNVETVLHHLMRGTGPSGIAGIRNARDLDEDLVLVRPMLGIRREMIRRGLTEIGQAWREDASNDDLHYRRNWIRHRLIPLIESEFPQGVDAIGRAIEGQKEWRVLIQRQAQDWCRRAIIEPDGHRLIVPRDSDTASPILVAAIQQLWKQLDWRQQEMTRTHWLRIAATIGGDVDERYSLPGAIEVDAARLQVEFRPRG